MDRLEHSPSAEVDTGGHGSCHFLVSAAGEVVVVPTLEPGLFVLGHLAMFGFGLLFLAAAALAQGLVGGF